MTAQLKYFPVSQLSDLDSLDESEMVEGYRAGLRNKQLPETYTRSYWHGWRNGMVDGRHMARDAAQGLLAERLVSNRPEWVKGVFNAIDGLMTDLVESHKAPVVQLVVKKGGEV